MAFTVSLPELYRAIDVAWDDAIQRAQFNAYCDSVKTCLQKQTAQLGDIIQGAGAQAKKQTRRVYWQNACNIAVQDRTDECAAATTELTDSSADYTINQSKESQFVTSFKGVRTRPHDLNKTVALGLMQCMKVLDEWLNAKYLDFLVANNGNHEYSLPVGAADGSQVWEIPAADFNSDRFADFMLSSKFSRYTVPFLLHGLNYYTDFIKASQYQPNLDGKGEANMFGLIPNVWDPIGFSASSIPTESFLVNAAAGALLTGNWYDQTPMQMAGNHRVYSMPSRNLPGVRYDIHELETCSSDDFVLSYKVQAYYEFVLNPLGCTATRTGILQFRKQAGV